MAKYHGQIGFAIQENIGDGVWEEKIEERTYIGDITKTTRQSNSNEYGTNNNINLTNTISVLADAFVDNNLHNLRYVTYKGVKWNVSSIDVQYPRLILSVGGVYNG